MKSAPASRTRLRRVLSVTAAVAAVTLLAGCFNFAPPRDLTSTPTGESVAAELEPYYSQVLTWSDCGNDKQCATAIAPMDWDNPSTETDIELALVRHVASGTPEGSLFVNPGGPGASGFDLVYASVDFAVRAELQESFDVIGWDPRGVGRSTPVTCFDDAELDEFIFGVPEAEVGSPEWLEEVNGVSADFAAACLEGTGPSLEFVDTQSTVHDLDMMRAIVGDEKLNYLGYSYGSDIGAYYAENFGQKVGRIVLDGATDSSISLFEVSRSQTAGFQRALENYLSECADTFDDCPFTGDLTADLDTIRGYYDRFDADPVAGTDGRLMNAGLIDIAMSMALYSESTWPSLNALFSEVEVGQTATAFQLADSYYSRTPQGTYYDNSFEAFLAIYCVDYPLETDPAVLADQQRQLQEASPTTYLDYPPIIDPTCGNWPFEYSGPGIGELTGADADDILVISTTGDPATPYEWGVALSDQLESAHLVTFNGEGHIAYTQGDPCVVAAVHDYFLEGTVPASDPNCGA